MSDRVTLSVVVPTRGRRSLAGTLASIAEQLEPGDELLVLCSDDGDFGNAARQSMLERARGTHVVFMDDDDQYARGAFDIMRRFAREHPGRVGIFRMRYLDGRLLWREPVVRRTNVSTQMFCVPNVPGRLGSWTAGAGQATAPRPEGARDVADYEFLAQTVALQGEPVFREEVVALIRSDRRALVRAGQRVAAVVRGVSRRVRRIRRAPRPDGTRG
jgi:glycosyltransferase involved in cell wall biosynthesis